MTTTDRDFFEMRVIRPETPCWIWRSIDRKGYGNWNRGGRHTYAHRIAYELFKGPIPEGLELHHICCNRCCVNPEHLVPATHAENVGFIPRTHCPHGHPYDEVNSYIRKSNGQRVCRTCRNESVKKWNEKKRAEEGKFSIKTHCKNGHERTPENTYTYPKSGNRTCKLCLQAKYLKAGGYKDPKRKRATYCPRGHEYTPENTYTTPKGYRYCRACNRAAAR